MLGDAKRPADHRAMGSRVYMRHVPNHVSGNSGLALDIIERVGFDAAAVFVEAGGRVVNEFLVFQTRRNNFSGYAVRQRDVGTDIETRPYIRPLNGARAPRVDSIEARAVPHSF